MWFVLFGVKYLMEKYIGADYVSQTKLMQTLLTSEIAIL